MKAVKFIKNTAKEGITLIFSIKYMFLDYFGKYYLSKLTEIDLRKYIGNLKFHPDRKLAEKINLISMLNIEVLILIKYLAGCSNGAVVEFGPYIGGSTIMLANSRYRQNKLTISVEPGGAHNHPTLTTNDIFSDLIENLKKYQVFHKVTLIKSHSRTDKTIKEIGDLVGKNGIGMLMIDSDGSVGTDMEMYDKYLNNQCILVFDDYISTHAPEKTTLIKAWVDDNTLTGKLKSLGVFGWGTWIGIYNKG